LVLACGQGIRRAIATSLIVIALQSGLGFLGYQWQFRSQQLSLHWPIVGLFAVVGSLGGLLGQRIGQRLNQDSLRRGFAILLLILGSVIVVRESWQLMRRAGSGTAASTHQHALDVCYDGSVEFHAGR
jgi:uncharacterized membrane protein YfcA